MKKTIVIAIAFAIINVFTPDIYAETIMTDKNNNINNIYFPDLTGYSLREKSEETANSSDINIQQAIWPFTGKNESESIRIKPKSTRKAFFLSLLLPGLGETYVGSKRNLIFFGIEALSWWMYISNTNEGKNLEDKFEGFADKYWHYFDTTDSEGNTLSYNYWEWLKRKYEMNEFSYGQNIMNPEDYYEPTDYAEINEHIKNNPKEESVHSLPSTKTQQYYEMIGKYDQFVYGWEDIDNHNLNPSLNDENGEPTYKYDEDTSIIKSPLRTEYMGIRGDSNDKLSAGQRGIHLMMINRIVSAIDAARLAYHHNKGLDSDLSMVRIQFVQKHIIDHKVPMLIFTKKF